jgi:hypothetical protein
MATTHPIRPFTDAEYAVVVLRGFQRMVRRTDLHSGFIHPRDVMRDNAENSEIIDALQYALDVIRLHMETEAGEAEASPAKKATP